MMNNPGAAGPGAKNPSTTAGGAPLVAVRPCNKTLDHFNCGTVDLAVIRRRPFVDDSLQAKRWVMCRETRSHCELRKREPLTRRCDSGQTTALAGLRSARNVGRSRYASVRCSSPRQFSDHAAIAGSRRAAKPVRRPVCCVRQSRQGCAAFVGGWCLRRCWTWTDSPLKRSPLVGAVTRRIETRTTIASRGRRPRASRLVPTLAMVNPIRVALAFTSMALFRRMAVGTAPKLRLTASLLKASLRNVASYRPHPMRQDAPLDDVERFQGVVLIPPFVEGRSYGRAN